MNTILVDQNAFLIHSIKERIMERSNLSTDIQFLIDPIYRGVDITDANVCLEYRLPISHKYTHTILKRQEELYKGKYKYVLDLPCDITSEHGDLELNITISKIDMDSDGTLVDYVHKTSTISIPIIPISKWCDYIPSADLSSVDQRILKNEAQIKACLDIAEVLDKSKADNLSLEGQTLQLTSNGQKIGDPKDLGGQTPADDSGMKVVEF